MENGAPAPARVEGEKGITPPSRRSGAGRRLGDVIVELGFAERKLVESALGESSDEARSTGRQLVDAGVVDSTQLAQALAERNGLDFVDLSVFDVDKGAANLVSSAEARRHGAIPVAFVDEGTLLVATSDPSNLAGFDDVAIATGYEVVRAVTTPEDIEALIGQLSKLSASVEAIEADSLDEPDGTEVIELLESAGEAPVVKLVHAVIADAVERGASDIHFDPRGNDIQVRFRVDGVVFDSTTVPRRLVAGLVSRIKIMAELDIAERRIPQDGRIALSVDRRPIDIRVSTLPVVRGESVVMRILDKDRVVMDLELLGMEEADRELVMRAIGKTQGAVLVTGPTGAGKTTTLYALLTQVNTPDRTLITIEDPVEYEVEGVKQVHVNAKTGLTFAAGLRSMLRSDPDTLVVGEIRDRETAQIAMESALTGHLVLSTLHTNNAPVAVARLIDMGIEPYLIASGIECVVAQRLARRLCEDCKEPAKATVAELRKRGFEMARERLDVYKPVGCVRCNGTGYRGRIGLYEVMVLSDEIRAGILRKATSDEIAAAAVGRGMRRLRDDGFGKLGAGITSIDEVLRVLGT